MNTPSNMKGQNLTFELVLAAALRGEFEQSQVSVNALFNLHLQYNLQNTDKRQIDPDVNKILLAAIQFAAARDKMRATMNQLAELRR